MGTLGKFHKRLTIDQRAWHMANTLLARSGADRLTIEQRVRCVRKKTLLARFGDDPGAPPPPPRRKADQDEYDV